MPNGGSYQSTSFNSKYKPSAKPRRPINAYAYYVQDNYRYQTRVTGYRDSVTIFGILSAEWKSATSEERELYFKRASKDRVRYDNEMMEYYRLVAAGMTPPATRSARCTDQPGFPVMTRSAFIFFSNSIRKKLQKENPILSYAGIMEKLGQKWSSMDESEREPFVRQRDTDKQRYNRQRRLFREAKKLLRFKESKKNEYERLLRLTKVVWQKPVMIEIATPSATEIDAEKQESIFK